MRRSRSSGTRATNKPIPATPLFPVSVVEELSRRQKQYDPNAAITFEVDRGQLRKHTRAIGRNDTPELSTEDLQFGAMDIGIWNGGNFDEGTQKIYGLVELSRSWNIDKCGQDLIKLGRLLAARKVSTHGTLETIAVAATYESFKRPFRKLSEPEAREKIKSEFWKWWDNDARAEKCIRSLLNIGIEPVPRFGKHRRVSHIGKPDWISCVCIHCTVSR